jgi:hypothetical protein
MTPEDRERLDEVLAAVEAQRRPGEAANLRERAVPEALMDASMEVATSSTPFALNGHQRNSQNGSRSHS